MESTLWYEAGGLPASPVWQEMEASKEDKQTDKQVAQTDSFRSSAQPFDCDVNSIFIGQTYKGS